MPDMAPKQMVTWLLIAAVVLFLGARALGSERSTGIDPGEGVTAATDSPEGVGGDVSGLRIEGAGEDIGNSIFVHVAGAVRRPGLYRLPSESRIAQAIRRAGGSRAGADLNSVNLAAPLRDGQQVVVPRRLPGGVAATAPDPAVAGAGDGSPVSVPSSAISLSTATTEQLEAIDGIGPVTAAKILDFRESQGTINSIEELDAVSGIGPATMEKLREALVP